MVPAIANGAAFGTGRDFAAWLGLVPKQISTGDRTILGRISKRDRRSFTQSLPEREPLKPTVRARFRTFAPLND